MQILVLDSIHGGRVIADYLQQAGHTVDLVDIYRHLEGISEEKALSTKYDLVTCPVHLDPCNPLLSQISAPVVTHHNIVRSLLKEKVNGICIEITGAKGKSTTAYALASLLPGPGILHTSSGLIRYPERKSNGRYSITPASLLIASDKIPQNGWIIGEISLGFCGIGSLGILTSDADYYVAGGKKHAYEIKKESSFLVPNIIVPTGVQLSHPGCIDVSSFLTISGDLCRYHYDEIDGEFRNSLLRLSGYKIPLMLAASAAMIMGISPEPLSHFEPMQGRMSVIRNEGNIIVDNANSGVSLETTTDAMKYGREISDNAPSTLIIGQEASSVCENFSTKDICESIRKTSPDLVILVAGDPGIQEDEISRICYAETIPLFLAGSCEEALCYAKKANNSLIVLSVKRWR